MTFGCQTSLLWMFLECLTIPSWVPLLPSPFPGTLCLRPSKARALLRSLRKWKIKDMKVIQSIHVILHDCRFFPRTTWRVRKIKINVTHNNSAAWVEGSEQVEIEEIFFVFKTQASLCLCCQLEKVRFPSNEQWRTFTFKSYWLEQHFC